ncbi:3976_t:CDS:1, partial [Racocetra persica]
CDLNGNTTHQEKPQADTEYHFCLPNWQSESKGNDNGTQHCWVIHEECFFVLSCQNKSPNNAIAEE